MTHGVNDTSEFTLSGITDTDEHDLPDVDGSESAYDARTRDRAVVYLTNEADQALTARLERAHGLDEGFNKPAKDVTGVSIASGETKTLTADPDAPLAYLRVVLSFDSAPSSADPSVTARFQTDVNG